MQTVGVVLLSIFGGVILVVLVAGLTALIWLHLRSQRAHQELIAAMAEFSKSTATMIDGAKASFTGIRQDIKNVIAEQGAAVKDTLSRHDAKVVEVVGKINATALEAAAQRGLAACIRLERDIEGMKQIARTLEALVHNTDMIAPNNLSPEEYGPSDTIYDMQSPTARMDAVQNETEATEATPLYSTPSQ